MMWRFNLNIEFGKVEPEPEQGDTAALVERTDPDRPPIGFYPPSDPTRRVEEFD